MYMTEPYYTWQDIAERYHCGRNKALKIVHTIGCHYIGRTPIIYQSDLDRYFQKNGRDIYLDW